MGGGIHGVAAAFEAARRGLSVALVERGDFGGATSFNHLKTLHGGLRSLQTADLWKYRESVRERATLARLAPHLVRPLPFLLPAGGGLLRSRPVLAAALLADAFLSADRNRGLPAALQLPAGRVVGRREALALAPELDQVPCPGAALWHDYQVVRTERLTLAFAEAAFRAGAVLANHVEAAAALIDADGRALGMRCCDRLSNETFDVSAAVTLNCTGAAVGPVAALLGASLEWPVQQAINLVTTRPAARVALGAVGGGGTLFLVPWRGRTVAGTWHDERDHGWDDTEVTAGQLARVVADINRAFPWLGLAEDEVTLVHRGVVPAVRGADGRLVMRTKGAVLDHAKAGVAGAISVVGVKYTTGRGVAERAVRLVLRQLGRPAPALASPLALPGGGASDPQGASAKLRENHPDLDEVAARRLVDLYGSEAERVLAAGDGRVTVPLAAGCHVLAAEVTNAVRHEMARTLADAVVRRLDLGTAGHPGEIAALAVARAMQHELGWSDDRVRAELGALRHFYRPVTRDAT